MQLIIALLLGIKRNGHIFIGLLLGIAVGILYPQTVEHVRVYNILNFVGQAFINIIQMVVLPLVISAIMIGIANIGDSKLLTKFGAKMFLYYSIITVTAVSVASGLACLIKPGFSAAGLINSEISHQLQTHVAEAMAYQHHNAFQILMDLIPRNPFAAVSDGKMIPVIIFVSIFAIALCRT
ncbi:MAG: cation:dicarboxylase symporter family transporter, partial [Candidatus Gastranaerophilales bacterium]|nr:cation:dicarboxylase symporter family transporter [Candidatus Gastranaerophilales bacterium]